jgi:alkaline phosphatase isozyme conversion protein
MLSALRRSVLCLMLSVGCALPAAATPAPYGETANIQARQIATHFPGRMIGTPAEMLSADFLRQQFSRWGYHSDIRQFHSRYIYTSAAGQKSWQNVTGSTVIAAHQGKAPQQIIIMAHLDTYTPKNDSERDGNLGGLTLQGMDDNALGLGVMLELAERLQNLPTRYGIRFIATSGRDEDQPGIRDVLKRMSPSQQQNILLVINLDNLVAGDRLWFNSGQNTPGSVRKLTRDRALTLAHRRGIPASAGLQSSETPNDITPFDQAGIPVLNISARHTATADALKWHSVKRDNPQYLDKHLPGRIEKRSRQVVSVLYPLVKELAKGKA